MVVSIRLIPTYIIYLLLRVFVYNSLFYLLCDIIIEFFHFGCSISTLLSPYEAKFVFMPKHVHCIIESIVTFNGFL